MKQTILFCVIVGLLLAWFPSGAMAAGVPIDPGLYPEGAATLNEDSLAAGQVVSATRLILVTRVVNFILGFAGLIAVYYIVSNAWYMMVAAGSEEKITQHKKGIMWALIGLLLIILSYSIIRFLITLSFSADQVGAG